jgi:hypothetical protein
VSGAVVCVCVFGIPRCSSAQHPVRESQTRFLLRCFTSRCLMRRVCRPAPEARAIPRGCHKHTLYPQATSSTFFGVCVCMFSCVEHYLLRRARQLSSSLSSSKCVSFFMYARFLLFPIVPLLFLAILSRPISIALVCSTWIIPR